MTAEELQALLDAGDVAGCVAFFEHATEAERRKLAKTAAARLRETMNGIPARDVPALLLLKSPNPFYYKFTGKVPLEPRLVRTAQVAVLATATLTELKRLGELAVPPLDRAYAVLRARRPPWVGAWVKLLLDRTGELHFNERWRWIHRLAREGLCERPRDPRYLNDMITAMQMTVGPSGIRGALLEHPDLLEHEVWEIFETEPVPGKLDVFHSWPNAPRDRRWEVALAQLADEGHLSRARLLDASLGGLERDFHEARTKWFALMHETLAPTPDERVERAERYLGLLASHTASTVKFALKVLKELDTAGRIDVEALAGAIAPALAARAKGTVLEALGLLARAAGRDEARRHRAAVVAVEALAHEAPAVHEAALDIIERHGEPDDEELVELLRARVDTIAASQRGRLISWLGTAPSSPVEETSAEVGELLERAAKLGPRLAELAGVNAAVEALKEGRGAIAAADFREADAPRLSPDRSIVPINDLDELIERFLVVLENATDAEGLERVLDGVSRLCDRVPDDFAARVGPLEARAEAILESRTGRLIVPVCGLALNWTGGQTRRVKHADVRERYRAVLGFFARRALAIARRAAQRQAAPLLSAPTHQGGWIDPRVLVERVRVWAGLLFPRCPLDRSLALLRLAPDPGARAEALGLTAGLDGDYAAALRHALGGARARRPARLCRPVSIYGLCSY